MEVDFVPYGNAHVYIYSTNLIIPRLFDLYIYMLRSLTFSFQQHQNGDSWEITCQHGPKECKGNIQQSCMFHYLEGKQDTYVDAIYCIEGSGDITNDENVKQVNCHDIL